MCCFRLVKGKVFINMGPCSEPVILLSQFLNISSNSPFPDPHSGRPAHFSDFFEFSTSRPPMVDQPISPISPYFFEFSTSRPPWWSTSPFLRFVHISWWTSPILRFLHISSSYPLSDPHGGRPAHFSDFSKFLRCLHFPTPIVVAQPISPISLNLFSFHFPAPHGRPAISPISPYFFEFSTSLLGEIKNWIISVHWCLSYIFFYVVI